MSGSPDSRLIGEFAANRSEQAFTELVERHAGLVFSTALRQLGNRELAREATQSVFIAAARKPTALRGHETVAGWFYKAALLESRLIARTELRRKRREEIAAELIRVASESKSVWEPRDEANRSGPAVRAAGFRHRRHRAVRQTS